MEDGGWQQEEGLDHRKSIQSLGRDIQDLTSELKQKLMDFKNYFRNEIKQEFNNFKTAIYQELQSIVRMSATKVQV